MHAAVERFQADWPRVKSEFSLPVLEERNTSTQNPPTNSCDIPKVYQSQDPIRIPHRVGSVHLLGLLLVLVCTHVCVFLVPGCLS